METDHDLLIELKTMVRLWHDESANQLNNHQKDDIRAIADLDTKVSAAHRRMDEIKRENAANHEALTKQVGDIISIKDRVLGGAVLLMFLITTGLSIVSVLKH